MSWRFTLRATIRVACPASAGDSRWRYHSDFALGRRDDDRPVPRDSPQRPAGDVVGRHRLLAHDGEVLPCGHRRRRGRRQVRIASPVEDRGVDRPGTQHADLDTVQRGLRSQAQGEPDHRVLARRVRRHERWRHQSGTAGGVHDVAAALRHHARIGGQHAVDHAADVHVDDALPVRGGELVGRATQADARVVEQHVEPAVAVDDLVDERTDRRLVADVDATAEDGACARRPVQLLRSARHGVTVDVREHHAGTEAHEPGPEGQSDAGGSPGDDRRPACLSPPRAHHGTVGTASSSPAKGGLPPDVRIWWPRLRTCRRTASARGRSSCRAGRAAVRPTR